MKKVWWYNINEIGQAQWLIPILGKWILGGWQFMTSPDKKLTRLHPNQ
jgi:hypothetical protein